jgi:hypothetical protein
MTPTTSMYVKIPQIIMMVIKLFCISALSANSDLLEIWIINWIPVILSSQKIIVSLCFSSVFIQWVGYLIPVGCDSLDVSPLLYIFFSLVNIYKELETDIDGFKHPEHGTLIGWSKQGR